MKESPEQKALHEKLLPGKISADGFLGDDPRNPQEIIRDDDACVDRLGTSHGAIASRMRYLTSVGIAELGRPVAVDGRLSVTVTDVMGSIPCPFSDNFRTGKRTTCVIESATGRSACWSDLNIHMIEQHGFYEGTGSFFRIDPTAVWSLIKPVL